MGRRLALAAVFAFLLASQARAANKVTLESLLKQMTDLSLLAEYPDPPYVAKQFSSYDRRSETPAKQGPNEWYANDDHGFMLYDGVLKEATAFHLGKPNADKPSGFFKAGTKVGIAPNRKPEGDYIWAYSTAPDGRPIGGKIPQGYVLKSAITMDAQGHVMAEMDGPGCLTRIWSANPDAAGKIRIYLDGADKPVIEAPMKDLLAGKWKINRPGEPGASATGDWTPFPDPIACERSRGFNLYFPIAYTNHCKITTEKQDIYYHVDYRTYPKGTEVEAFRLGSLAQIQPRINRVLRAISPPYWNTMNGKNIHAIAGDLKVGDRVKVSVEGSGIIRGVQVRLDSVCEDNLRSLLMVGTFDNAAKAQIWCPVGDFFASSPGINQYRSLPFTVHRGMERVPPGLAAVPETLLKGTYLDANWPMAYEKSAVFEIVYLGKEPKSGQFELQIVTDNYKWSDRSMHFHAKWRTETMKTRPFRDWTYCDLKGKGVFVGDMLSIFNPKTAWWGEGDEKIYVDGEKFPSWFGTGTEDYYGYAWSDPKPFQHAYHNQTRCDGPVTKGHTSVNRFHILDAIPFEKSFKFDMEVWHWIPDINVTYAATSYWYARPGATDDFKEVDAKTLQDIPKLPPPYKIAGAVEGEKMKVLAKNGISELGPQDMEEFDGHWSGDEQLWVRADKPASVDLELPVAADGEYQVTAYLTKARDYGIVQFSLDGKKIGKEIDCFEPERVVGTGPVDLGAVELRKGKATLRLAIVETNPKSVGSRYMAGLDCVVLKKK